MSAFNIDWKSNNLEGIPGKTPISLPEKTTDSTSTSLTLTGRGVASYGEIQQENFLHLLENFASANPPEHSTIGQLWFNSLENVLYVKVDPTTVGPFQAKYYPQSPASWIQIWPSVQEYAALNEYNALAIQINRIIGHPTTIAGTVPLNQYGWGQDDLVPVYIDASTLAPGFNPAIYPPAFDNNAWVILLSRLRKALRHVGQPETGPSPVGFISDGRPNKDGNPLAVSYNNYPVVGTLPDYKSGWNGTGQISMQVYYTNTVNAITQLEAGRFDMAPASAESLVLGTKTRTASWDYTLEQTVEMTFTSVDAANAYFNTGGHVQFNFGLTSIGSDTLSTEWQSFLSYITGLTFDFKGIRKGNVYCNAPSLVNPLGFYNLTTSPQVIYLARRDDPSGTYSTITDGGLQIEAFYTSGIGGTLIVNFKVSFVEAPYPGETVAGTLTTSCTVFKAQGINISSPAILYPSLTSSNIDLVAVIPAQGPPVSVAPLPGATYNIQPSVAATIGEGLVGQTFTVTTTGVSDGTILYWTTVAGSGINSTDFTDSVLSGSVTINSNTGSFVRTAAADSTTEGTEVFSIQLRTGSIAGPIVATSANISIGDYSTTPTAPTGVFNLLARAGNSTVTPITGIGFQPDMVWSMPKTGLTNYTGIFDLIPSVLLAGNDGAELSVPDAITSFNPDGITVGIDASQSIINASGNTYVNYFFKESPGFFNKVHYVGTGSNTTINHSLGVAPDLMIIKNRNGSTPWRVYGPSTAMSNSQYLTLSSNNAASSSSTMWNNTTPTSTNFTIGTNPSVNTNSSGYLAMLFASQPGVSKIDTYTGNGSSQTINCGFGINGPRFILIKRIDAAGSWLTFDTARGIVLNSADPFGHLDGVSIDVNGIDSVDPTNAGFIVKENASSHINVNGGTYIYFAIA